MLGTCDWQCKTRFVQTKFEALKTWSCLGPVPMENCKGAWQDHSGCKRGVESTCSVEREFLKNNRSRHGYRIQVIPARGQLHRGWLKEIEVLERAEALHIVTEGRTSVQNTRNLNVHSTVFTKWPRGLAGGSRKSLMVHAWMGRGRIPTGVSQRNLQV